MPSAIARFNALDDAEATEQLLGCLHSPGWAEAVLAGRPYPDQESLLATAHRLGVGLSDADLTAALTRHPRIGERPTGDGRDAAHSRREQGGVDPADAELAERLRQANLAYEKRFGTVFLIRAAGRTGSQMLAALEQRLTHDDATEAVVIREQLAEIAGLRLTALLQELTEGDPPMTSLSTHVLDSVTGTPAVGMRVHLEHLDPTAPQGQHWSVIGEGTTDQDGRVRQWGPETTPVVAGVYRLTFDTDPWFAAAGRSCFYPQVSITFRVDDERHYHVPILLAPYAYSTYRGS